MRVSADHTEHRLVGLPGFVLTLIALAILAYAVVEFLGAALPLARWMTFVPPS